MKYIYATVYAVAAAFITLIFVMDGNPSGVLVVLEALLVAALVFAGTVAVMSHFSQETPEATGINYKVKRALRVEGLSEAEAGATHYYFELMDNRVLFLALTESLAVFALPDSYSETDGPLFPNSDFTILREKDTGELLGAGFHGTPLPAETLRIRDDAAYRGALTLSDGEVTDALSYGEIKRRISEV